MSLPKVASKSKDQDGFNTLNFTSSFDRARLIFQEIETILEAELADTPQIVANYEHNVARVKSKRKRGGPFLIKPLNKSKARKTIDDMEFDPVLGVWVGNDEIMKSFAAHQPALITNKGRHDKPKTVGKMVWDAKEHKWGGNEDELRFFEPLKRPPLISKLSSDQTPKEINGMIFDHIKMRWVGNDVDLLDFGTISESSPDDGFVVGTEFMLSPTAIQMITECARRHKATTAGWWQDDRARNHLHIIRTMSIMRVVRDVKRTTTFSYLDEPADMDIAAEKENGLVLKTPSAVTETDFDDAEWDDVGPFVGTAKIKLPDVESSGDLDVDLEQEGDKTKSNRRSKNLEEEDWDIDFSDLDKINQKIRNSVNTTPLSTGSGSGSGSGFISGSGSSSGAFTSSNNLYTGTITQLNKDKNLTPTVLEKKPFALLKADAPQRRSFHQLTSENGNKSKPKQSSDEDEELGLDIPTGPLQLKLNKVATVSDEDVNVDLDEEGEREEREEEVNSSHDEPFEQEEPEEVEEEWFDVEVPPTLGEPVTKRPDAVAYTPPPVAEREEWDDFPQIPTEKLELKMTQQKMRQQQISMKESQKKGKEEDLDGIEIPDNFHLRLKRK